MTEPNEKMDELLRGYARQRRQQAGPPVQIHPATRNLLQAEVARTYRLGGASTRKYALAMPNFWPRLLLGMSCVALTLIGAGLWLRFDQQRELQLARASDRNLYFFNQSAPETPANPLPVQTDGVPERIRGFALAENEQKTELSARPPKELEQLRDQGGALTSGPSALRLEIASASTGPSETFTDSPSARFALATGIRADAGPLPGKDVPVVSAGQPADLSAALQPPPGAKREIALAQQAPSLASNPALDAAEPSSILAPTPEPKSDAPVPAGPLAFNATPPAPVAKNSQTAPLPRVQTALATDTLAASRFGSPAFAQTGVSAQSSPSGWRFEQVDNKYRQNLNSPPAPRVLNTFQLQRIGNELQIIDADGSVYSGTIQAPSRPARSASASGSGLGSAANQQQVTADNTIRPLVRENAALPPFSFRAVGTNRTLNQVVVFTGAFEPNSASLNQAIPAGSLENRSPQAQSGQQVLRSRSAPATLTRGFPPPAANSFAESNRLLLPGRIEGRATVGPKNAFRIDAQQVEP